MASVREIAARLGAAHQFRKVAAALRAIAATNLGFAERVRAAAEAYDKRVSAALDAIVGPPPPLPPVTVILAFAAEGGFCGTIDDSVFAELKRRRTDDVRTIVIGRRGARRARDAAIRFNVALAMAAHIADFDDRIATVAAQIRPDDVVLLLAPHASGETHSVLSRTIAPRSVPTARAHVPATNQPISELLPALARECVHAAIALFIAEAFAAENLVRFRLMDGACKQTDETRAALTLALSHARDAQISEDIFEIFAAERTIRPIIPA